MTLKILHLEDNPADAELVKRVLMRSALSCEVLNVDNADAYQSALQHHAYDLILSDSGIPGYDGRAALLHAHASRPGVPFIVVSGRVDENRRPLLNEPQPAAQLAKSRLDRLPEIIQNTLQQAATGDNAAEQVLRDMQYLVAVLQALSLARDHATVMDIVRHAARKLVGAEGAAILLREDDHCIYVQEDAPVPLRKGKRLALDASIAGWTMLNRQSLVIADICKDGRVTPEEFGATFIKSLAITPIRTAAPVGAIAVYWARSHEASKHEMSLLTALADSTSVAMEAVQLLSNLELKAAKSAEALHRRCKEVEVLSKELQSFSHAVAHDLRAPLITIEGFSHLLVNACAETISDEAQGFVVRITAATARMQTLINDLLALSKLIGAPMNAMQVDLSKLATDVVASLAQHAPERNVEFVCNPLMACADEALMRILLGNLLSNAWKFTSKTAAARIEFGLFERNDSLSTFFLRDNGAGFDPRYCSNLFSPFHRLHSQDQFPGNGVGLAAARRIVNRHGGEIRAEAEVNRGAVFYFSLPNSG